MDPYSNQQPQQPPTSIDYLDSIAAAPQHKTMSPKLLWSIIIGGLLLAAVLFFTIMGALSGGTSPSERFLSYEYRVAQLTKITDDESKTIKSSDLRALNGSLHTILGRCPGRSRATTAKVQHQDLQGSSKRRADHSRIHNPDA